MRYYLKRFMMVANPNVFVVVLLFLDLKQRRGPCASANRAGQPAEPAAEPQPTSSSQGHITPARAASGSTLAL